MATTAMAARTAFSTLSSSEQSNVQDMLAKWKALYQPIAEAHGFLPHLTESSNAEQEELERFHNTMQDVEEAARMNPEAEFSPFNQFALLNEAEFKAVVQQSFAGHNFTDAAPLESVDVSASEADWSTSKCNPPVRNQGSCGSCWAFATVGAVEAAHCIATGELLDLSEQQLVSCDKKSYGCNGGFPPSAFDWMQQGVCTEESYPYKGQTGTCATSCTKKTLSIGKTKQTSGDSSLVTVLNSQPASVVVEAGNNVWRNYKSGVVTQCPGAQSDHAVIAVGYGTSTGDYFKIKNSWGPQWGDKGYIYLKRGVSGKGTCNVVEGISYTELKGSPAPTSNAPTPSSSKPTPSSSKPTPSSSKPSPSTRKPLPSTPAPGPSTYTPSSNPTTATPGTTKPRCTKKPKTKKPKTPSPSDGPTYAPTSKPSPSSPTRKPLPTGPTPSSSSPTRKPLPTGPTPSSYSPTPAPSSSGNGMQDQLIAQTNKIRAAHGVGPVTWDAALATKMQAWADSCPGFKHGGPSGWQNLATNTPCGNGKQDCSKVVGASWLWYDQEETYWNYGSSSCNGDWAKCGHFSNMMSPEVKSMACGWSQCGNGNYVWCNYNTPVKNPKVPQISGMTKTQLKASLVA